MGFMLVDMSLVIWPRERTIRKWASKPEWWQRWEIDDYRNSCGSCRGIWAVVVDAELISCLKNQTQFPFDLAIFLHYFCLIHSIQSDPLHRLLAPCSGALSIDELDSLSHQTHLYLILHILIHSSHPIPLCLCLWISQNVQICNNN